jgi:hypothetical protein
MAKERKRSKAKAERLRQTARLLLPPENTECPCCDLSVGCVCEACEAASQLFLAARTIEDLRAEMERLRDALSAAIRFAGYAKVLCQDDHVTPEYLEGYRERFLAFEAALSDDDCKRAARLKGGE